jgi:hypothetical protein
MNWNNFRTHNQAPTEAFESLCIQLFERWVQRTYKEKVKNFYVVNGAGGDGGVEAYALLKSNEVVAVQAKWFPDKIEDQQIRQIDSSVKTAMKVRPNIISYTVCIPRNLGNETGRGAKSEQNRWDNMEKSILGKYSNLSLVLWNKHTLTSELQKSGNEGIRKFWFESEEFDLELFKRRFDLMKAGWLRDRYIPSLHALGMINEITEGLLITSDFRQKLLPYIHGIKGKMEIARHELSIALNDKEIIPESKHETGLSLFGEIEQYLGLLDEIEHALIKGIYIKEFQELQSVNVSDFIKTLKGSTSPQRELASFELTRSLNELKEEEPFGFDRIRKIGKSLERHNTIISGQPGTGKTHGITDVVNIRISKNHPSILIRAKDVKAREGWGSILRSALGLSYNWSDEELFSALEATAYRAHINRLYNETKENDLEIEETCLLIAIDGIEESVELDAWGDRLGELDQILVKHHKIRFCIMVRPYVFAKGPLPLSRVDYTSIREDGDVPVSDIFDQYIRTFNINVDAVPWVQFALKTPLALKLFCELYSGRVLLSENSLKTTVSHLLLSKIKKIDNEVKVDINGNWVESDQVILRG